MATQFTYSITNDFPNQIVNLDGLTVEIGDSSISVALDFINVNGDVVDIFFVTDLTGPDETELDVVVAAHLGNDPVSPEDQDFPYDPTGTSLTATNQPDAITELDTNKASTSHAATHIQGGSDEVDGDQIDVDFTPSNYTPNTTPPEVTNVDQLSAHLSGIDSALASVGGNVAVEDNDVQVVAAASTLNFGTNLDVTDDGGGKVTIDAPNLVPDSRQIIAGAGLIGGGDLTADRTLNVAANLDGSIVVNANDIQVGILATDAQHGNRGGGSLHATATGVTAGFLSASDKSKLDGIEPGAEVNDVDSVFGRTGAVVAATSDYDAIQIDFTPDGDITSTNVQAAIVELRDDTDTKLAGKASTTHASTHIQGGSDEIDGDQIDIDFTPANYTPNTTPPEVTDVDQLSAHLSGIDTALAGIGADDKRVQVSLDDTTPGFLEEKIVAGANIAVSTLNPGGNETFQISATGLVPDSRQIIAGAGLTGGGDLTADRTLDVVANVDGSIVVNANDIQVGVLATDAQHGDRGGGSLHANATGLAAGFLSAVDKLKLDGIEAGAEVNDVDSVFGRTGAVAAQASDYDAVQVDFTPNGDIAATNVQAAIVEVRDDTDTKLAGKASTTHAATHIQGGSDEVDGDQIDIDFTPTNYTPNTTPPEVTDLDHLSAHLSGIDTALASAGGSISVEDDDVEVVATASTLNFGDSLTVTDDGGGKVTIDGENAGRAIITIWAEESAALGNNNYEWSFGNGDEAPQGSGIPVPIDCVLFALSLDHSTNGSATVAVQLDGVQAATVSTTAERNNLNTLVSPVNVTQGQVIGFQTITGTGSSAGNRVTAYFRTTPFGAGAAVDSVFGRTGAVVAAASDYDANQVDFTPNGDIAATDVQAAIVEVRDDTDTKLAAKADTSTQIIAGAGLTGGGDLSTDRTLNVAANADGSIVVNANDIQVGILATDAQHGNRGGGSLHAVATGATAGFQSAADKSKLDGIEAGAEVNDVFSVFGRVGAVVAATSDYDAVQVDFTPDGDIAATNVQAAIVEVRDDTDTKLAGKANITHASTHIKDGSDEIDGDQLDIDYTPTNYTPTVTPPEASDLDHLTAHLGGLDDIIGFILSNDDLAAVQRRKTADQNLIGTGFNDITFPTTDIEIDTAVVEADGANDDRILINEDGLYLIYYGMNLDTDGDNMVTITGRIQVNDSTVVNGSTAFFEERDDGKDVSHFLSKLCLANLTDGDFLTVEASSSQTANGVTVASGAIFVVLRLSAVNGADGPQGPPGPTGSGVNINVQENGVALGNTPNDILNYQFGIEATAGASNTAQFNVKLPGISSYEGGGGQTFTGTNTTIDLDNDHLIDGTTFSRSGGEITVLADGEYDIDADLSLEGNNSSRSQAEMWLENNGTEIPGTRATHYLRNNNYGAAASVSISQNLTNGDTIRIRAVRTVGTTTVEVIPNGARLRIRRVA